MQGVEGGADDAVAHTGQPAGAAFALFVHVQAQHFDEQHFGEFGQDPFAAGAGRAGFGEGVAHGGFQPDTGTRTAHVDPHHGWQALEQHARQARVARQVATHQAGDRATTAIAQLAGPARQHRIQSRTRGRGQSRSGAHAMGVALRENHHVAGAQQQRRVIAQFDVALAIGDQVKDHHPFRIGLQERRGRVGAGRLVAPGRGEPGVDEDRADQVHHPQGL
ncbi:hypothetical protein D9M73_146760 [compost metagenome]